MKKTTAFIILIFIILASFSCSKEKSTQTEEYIIKVDSIQLNSYVAAGQKIQVSFFGIIGSNGCSSFSRYIVKSLDGTHSVTLVGKRKVGENIMCTENLPMLIGLSLDLPADTAGMYTIEIINPGINNLISKKIAVNP
jgi:hypothetical protein